MDIKTDQSGSDKVKPNHMDKGLNKHDTSTAIRSGQVVRSGQTSMSGQAKRSGQAT